MAQHDLGARGATRPPPGGIGVELQFIDQRLQRADFCCPCSADEQLWALPTYRDSLDLVDPKPIGAELAPARVAVVVGVDLCTAFEADGDGVVDLVRPMLDASHELCGSGLTCVRYVDTIWEIQHTAHLIRHSD